MPILTLQNGSYNIDFSRNVQTFTPEIEPSFAWIDLINGTIRKERDLGPSSDKFYSTIELALSFAEYINFRNFYAITKGMELSISTSLDLFVPSLTNYQKVIITEITDSGYLGSDIMTQCRLVKVRLFLLDPIAFDSSVSEATTQAPALIDKYSIWTNALTFSDKFQTKDIGQGYTFSHFDNDTNLWTVDFKLLTKQQAFYMIVWILNIRTSIVGIDTNPINANNTRAGFGNYNIRDFQLRTEDAFYSLTLDLVKA